MNKPKLSRAFRLAVGSLFAFPIACTSTPTTKGGGGSQPKVDITGHWKSDCLPGQNGQSANLDFQIGAASWALDYTTFADAACNTAFVVAHVEGPYEIDGASAKVAGANDARMAFTKKTVTPRGGAAVQYLSSLPACGTGSFTDGQATDVFAAGCAGLGQYPMSACPADYDVVAVQGTDLRFGSRPADNDMCTPDKRPTALAAFASHRVP